MSWEILNETFPQPLLLHFADGIMRLSWNLTSPSPPTPPLPALLWVFFSLLDVGNLSRLSIIPVSKATLCHAALFFKFFYFWLERIPAHLSSGILGDDCSLINPAAISPLLPAPPADVQTFLRAIPNIFQTFPGRFSILAQFPTNPSTGSFVVMS